MAKIFRGKGVGDVFEDPLPIPRNTIHFHPYRRF